MVRYLLCLLVTTIVQVECFRVPLPYGTGYQGSTNQDDELSDQGIFHLLWHSSKAARGRPEGPTEQSVFKIFLGMWANFG